MSIKLSKSSIVVLCLSVLALISMCFNVFGDSLYEMVGEESQFYWSVEILLAWMHIITYGLINVFNWISKEDFAFLFSGINLFSLMALVVIQLIFYNGPEFGLGFFLMAISSITILIICHKKRSIQTASK